MLINDLLNKMLEKKASDLHLKVGRPPLLRIDGKITQVELPLLTEADIEEMLFAMMSQRQRVKFAEANEIDLSYSPTGSARYRINAFRQKSTIEIIIRMIPKDIPSFDALTLPPILKKVALESRGLILMTGATGSGKSTTLASLVKYINDNQPYHIITIEDPIEFMHTDSMSSVTQRELGIDTDSYDVALKYVLRQDPDVVFIGEMRDIDTVSAAISAGETGHLVLSTLHTIDASQTIDRLIDFYPASQQNQIRNQLANIITAIISMRLIEKADGKGRVPAVEVMLGTPTIKSLIRENKLSSIKSMIQQGSAQYGMQTFDQSLAELYKKGLITLDMALAEATSKNDLKLSLSGIISSVDSAREQMK
ncbi:MAG: type IV pili twitching motility protein PilT [Candidatus Firestonebacteria bacterium RIFOXYC2_FULL_39_67]|nr:MAG: type IV pili twitching motility protein PilT [Candidatus Firestonebacteria bacterium RIFOXYD2_FULL_39_29]OGF53886.1 MAG: type IV pili twitching motility protein PilT [Candidatus Firestonebacteria bacterium RIFOXYC2_FULL_39_67]